LRVQRRARCGGGIGRRSVWARPQSPRRRRPTRPRRARPTPLSGGRSAASLPAAAGSARAGAGRRALAHKVFCAWSRAPLPRRRRGLGFGFRVQVSDSDSAPENEAPSGMSAYWMSEISLPPPRKGPRIERRSAAPTAAGRRRGEGAQHGSAQGRAPEGQQRDLFRRAVRRRLPRKQAAPSKAVRRSCSPGDGSARSLARVPMSQRPAVPATRQRPSHVGEGESSPRTR